MFRTFAIAIVAAGLTSTSSFSQSTGSSMPESWRNFFNTDGSMKAENDVMTSYGAMSADQKAKVKEDCTKSMGAPGGGGGMELSEAQQAFCNMVTKM